VVVHAVRNAKLAFRSFEKPQHSEMVLNDNASTVVQAHRDSSPVSVASAAAAKS
jgi:hypothetical protein